MKKLFFKKITIILFCVLLTITASLAETSTLDVSIKGKYTKKTKTLIREANFNIQKDKDLIYKDIVSKYSKLQTSFNREYTAGRKLVSESSTVKQALDHSKDLLDICLKYFEEYSDVKEQVLLQLLVGHWSGDAEITFKETSKDQVLIINRKMVVDLSSDQAGQISEGMIKGNEIITKEKAKQSKNEQYTTNISGAVSGNVVPQTNTTLFVSINENLKGDKGLKKFNKFELVGKNYINMKPIVSREVIDEAYSLTVSDMKIYYSLLFKTESTIEQLLKDKYNLFFTDILFLLKVTAKGYVTEEVYKSLKIYPKSEYVTKAFEEYVITLKAYIGRLITTTNSKKQKITLYKKYLAEMIQVNAICHLGIVSSKSLNRLNLNINKPNNLINNIYSKLYVLGKEYYSEEIRTSSGKRKQDLKKEYMEFINEMIGIGKTGIINSETLKELGVTTETIPLIDNI